MSCCPSAPQTEQGWGGWTLSLMGLNPELKISNIEFDIFGFSRGAAAARHFANELLKPNGCALATTLNAQTQGFVPSFDWAVNASINFIGLFDTVAAIVDVSRGDFSPANERNPGVNLYLPPGCARKVLQLAARDEQRENFALNSVTPQHQEISLPGVHSDLGGGYRPRQTEKLLISQPRSTLVTPGRPLEHSSAWRETQMAIEQLEQRGLPGDGEIKPVHKYFATPGQHGNNSQNQRAIVAAAIEREVRGELSRVYLRIMRALAVKHEVPFKEIPDNTSFAIPSDLQAIAEKITAGAMGQGERLSSIEERHLHARYIHLSAHWTPSKGLLINKPAKQRQIYRNSPQGGELRSEEHTSELQSQS